MHALEHGARRGIRVALDRPPDPLAETTRLPSMTPASSMRRPTRVRSRAVQEIPPFANPNPPASTVIWASCSQPSFDHRRRETASGYRSPVTFSTIHASTSVPADTEPLAVPAAAAQRARNAGCQPDRRPGAGASRRPGPAPAPPKRDCGSPRHSRRRRSYRAPARSRRHRHCRRAPVRSGRRGARCRAARRRPGCQRSTRRST